MSLDAEENAYLDRILADYKKEQLHKIAPDLENIFKECVDEVVYESYSPVQWDRQYRLLDHIVTVDEDNGTVFLHEDLMGAGYFSTVDGSNQDANLDRFIFESHTNGNARIDNMYNFYPYAENPSFEPGEVFKLAKQKIESKYPELSVKIIMSNE